MTSRSIDLRQHAEVSDLERLAEAVPVFINEHGMRFIFLFESTTVRPLIELCSCRALVLQIHCAGAPLLLFVLQLFLFCFVFSEFFWWIQDRRGKKSVCV